MDRSSEIEGHYRFATEFIVVIGIIGPLMEALGDFASFRNHIPYPFDIFASAGNMWVGTFVAMGLTITRWLIQVKRTKDLGERHPLFGAFTRRELRRFQRKSLLWVVLITALLNLLTETRWAVDNLPIAKALNAPFPDPLDLVYSCLWGVAVLYIPWRKIKSRA